MKKLKLNQAVAFVVLVIIMAISVISQAAGESEKVILNSMSLKTDKVIKGNKIYVDIDITNKENVDRIEAYFFNSEHSELYPAATLKDLDTDRPYFDTDSILFQPDNTYEMSIVNVKDKKGNDVAYISNPETPNEYLECYGKNKIEIIEAPRIQKIELTNNKTFSSTDELEFDFKVTGVFDYASVWIRSKTNENAKFYCTFNTENSKIDLSKLSPMVNNEFLCSGEYYIGDIYLNPSDISKLVHYSTMPEDSTVLGLNEISFTVESYTKQDVNKIKEFINKEENRKYLFYKYSNPEQVSTKDSKDVPEEHNIKNILKLKNGNYQIKVGYSKYLKDNVIVEGEYERISIVEIEPSGNTYKFISCESENIIKTEENNTNKNKNTNTSKNTNTDNTRAKGTIPKTGSTIVVSSIIVIFIIINGIEYFIKYRNIDK